MTPRLFAAAVLLLGLVLGAPLAAHAHDSLVGSDPPTGAQLDSPPRQVRLTFSGPVLELGAAAILVDQAGTTWPTADLVPDGSTVAVPIGQDLPEGDYELRWRVVSSDGHPISGVVTFVVGDGSSVGTVAVPPGAETTPAQAQDAATEPQQPAATAAQTADQRPLRTVLVGLGGAGLALLLLLLIQRRRRPAPQGATTTGTNP